MCPSSGGKLLGHLELHYGVFKERGYWDLGAKGLAHQLPVFEKRLACKLAGHLAGRVIGQRTGQVPGELTDQVPT